MSTPTSFFTEGDPWSYYIRNKGKYGYLGIVDKDGNAPDTANKSIKIYFDEIPDTIDDDDAAIPVNKVDLLGLAKGVAAEYLNTLPVTQDTMLKINLYRKEYTDTMKSAKLRKSQDQGPIIQKPLKLL